MAIGYRAVIFKFSDTDDMIQGWSFHMKLQEGSCNTPSNCLARPLGKG